MYALAAIDGANFKGVNSRNRNFTEGKLKRRVEQVESSIERYLPSLEAELLLQSCHGARHHSRRNPELAGGFREAREVGYRLKDSDAIKPIPCITFLREIVKFKLEKLSLGFVASTLPAAKKVYEEPSP